MTCVADLTPPYQRLFAYMDENRFMDATLAKKIGVAQPRISEARMGKKTLERHWLKIADVLGLDLNWILRGEGRPTYVASSNPPESEIKTREINYALAMENAKLREQIKEMKEQALGVVGSTSLLISVSKSKTPLDVGQSELDSGVQSPADGGSPEANDRRRRPESQ